MLSNLFNFFLVTLCDFKRTCICRPFESDARTHAAVAPGVFARSRATGFSSAKRESLCVCVCVFGRGGGFAPLQFKPHCGSLYNTRTNNVHVLMLVVCNYRCFKGTCCLYLQDI